MGVATKYHKEGCNCWGCASKRGDFSGVNSPHYVDGRSLQKHYCSDCGKEIYWRTGYYGTGKCGSCRQKGKKLSEEHKKKIAESGRAIQFKRGHTTNVGREPWNKGLKNRYFWSKEARERNKNSPHYFSRGEEHPLWKGGVCKPSILIRASSRYGYWREFILKRDNRRCVICKSKKQIEAHHITRLSKLIETHNIESLDDAYNCEELWDISNGETLCRECHKVTMVGQHNN